MKKLLDKYSSTIAVWVIKISFIIIVLLIALSFCHLCQKRLDFFAVLCSALIAIGNALLLYATLNSQKQGIANEKNARKQERFETTFFNLLDKHIEQFNRINFAAIMLQNPPNEEYTIINGNSFITFAFGQLHYLKAYFSSKNYLGCYDSSVDWKGYDDKKTTQEKLDYDEYLRTKYIANIYGINQQQFEIYKKQIETEEKTTLQICYQLFYSRWGKSYDHYLSMVKALVEFIESQGKGVSSAYYMKIFKGCMSSKELQFLNYHASIDQEFAEILQKTSLFEKDLVKNLKQYDYETVF